MEVLTFLVIITPVEWHCDSRVPHHSTRPLFFFAPFNPLSSLHIFPSSLVYKPKRLSPQNLNENMTGNPCSVGALKRAFESDGPPDRVVPNPVFQVLQIKPIAAQPNAPER